MEDQEEVHKSSIEKYGPGVAAAVLAGLGAYHLKKKVDRYYKNKTLEKTGIPPIGPDESEQTLDDMNLPNEKMGLYNIVTNYRNAKKARR